jgi:hypothetical protein
MRSLRRLIAADNMTQKENAKVEAQSLRSPAQWSAPAGISSP